MNRAWTSILIGVCLCVPIDIYALTPKEREKVKLAWTALGIAKVHNATLQTAVDQAQVEISNANSSAGSAWASAFTVGVTARKAQAEAERCQKENAEMRPIVAAVTGPWWFPGGRALLYGAKKSAISLVVILVGAFVLVLVIKVLITVFTGGTVTAGLGAATGILGKLGRWFGRALKRLLSFFTRRGKTALDNIEHKTIGSDPPL